MPETIKSPTTLLAGIFHDVNQLLYPRLDKNIEFTIKDKDAEINTFADSLFITTITAIQSVLKDHHSSILLGIDVNLAHSAIILIPPTAVLLKEKERSPIGISTVSLMGFFNNLKVEPEDQITNRTFGTEIKPRPSGLGIKDNKD